MVSLRLGQDTALTVDLPVIHSRVPRFATLPAENRTNSPKTNAKTEHFLPVEACLNPTGMI